VCFFPKFLKITPKTADGGNFSPIGPFGASTTGGKTHFFGGHTLGQRVRGGGYTKQDGHFWQRTSTNGGVLILEREREKTP